MWKALGIDQHVSLQLNSIGSLEARANYRSALVAFLENHQDLMSDEEKERLVKIHYVFWILKSSITRCIGRRTKIIGLFR